MSQGRLHILKEELKSNAHSEKARILQRFFKTGRGEYAEGDVFLGITVPVQRRIAHRFLDLDLQDIANLIQSAIHEYRFTALEILIAQFESGTPHTKKAIYQFYIKHRKYINNWDLVDTSAEYIVGAYLAQKSKEPLTKLARSRSVWDRRIAIVSTFAYIKDNNFSETLRIAKYLRNDSHDLIRKAVGWMLREIGKRSRPTEEYFLKKYHKDMPRIMLRYALEHFPKETRKQYV